MDSVLETLPMKDDIRYPNFPALADGEIESHFKNIKNHYSQDSDVIICTYPKSGSHWIYEMVSMIMFYKTRSEQENIQNRPPLLLLEESRKAHLEETTSPKIMHTHLRMTYLPNEHLEKKRKIVHMIRNPKDLVVSMYWHFREAPFIKFVDLQWEDFFNLWMSGKQPFGSWYDYELLVERAEKENPGMIYTLFYEDAKKEPLEQIKKLANFLEVECPDNIAEKIAEATSFSNMKKANRSTLTRSDGTSILFRKGEVGDWKNLFTVAQNERFDLQYKEKMNGRRYNVYFQ